MTYNLQLELLGVHQGVVWVRGYYKVEDLAFSKRFFTSQELPTSTTGVLCL